MKVKYKAIILNAMPFGCLHRFTKFLHQINLYKTFDDCFKKLHKVLKSYNLRGHVEKHIEELKKQYALG